MQLTIRNRNHYYYTIFFNLCLLSASKFKYGCIGEPWLCTKPSLQCRFLRVYRAFCNWIGVPVPIWIYSCIGVPSNSAVLSIISRCFGPFRITAFPGSTASVLRFPSVCLSTRNSPIILIPTLPRHWPIDLWPIRWGWGIRSNSARSRLSDRVRPSPPKTPFLHQEWGFLFSMFHSVFHGPEAACISSWEGV